jgi:hypothetical protein
MLPAEPLVVLCLLAQRARGPEPDLEPQRNTAQDPSKSGGRTCDSDTAARNESEETTRLAENLNLEIRTLSVAPVFLPHELHFSAGTLKLSSETPEETYLAMTVVCRCLQGNDRG